MERRDEVIVKSGAEYDHLFPKAMNTTILKKEGATVADTIKFIPQVVNETLFHTKKIAQVLKRDTVRETCRAIWEFVYNHIAYKKDEDGKEQVRSPARAWHDRKNTMGVDCDCYTTFISSILSNLKIRHALRIAKYKEDYFQHIYPIVPLADGTYITIDCVVRKFDYEEPYSEKKDTKMDLEYLNGVNDSKAIDAMDLLEANPDYAENNELGKLFGRGTNPYKSDGSKKGKLKDLLHKGLNFTNKANPATAILRFGVVAAMEMNVFKIAQRLKYAYLSDEEAKAKGIDMDRFEKLKKVKKKIENIFYDAGGKLENLQKAILKGRGNKKSRHDVNGVENSLETTNSLEKILGTEIYESEMSGLGSLGEPYSAATAITAATGILAAIAGLLKGVGNIFPKKAKGAEDFKNTDNATKDTAASDGSSTMDTSNVTTSEDNSSRKEIVKTDGSSSTDNSLTDSEKTNKSVSDKTDDTGNPPVGFWAKNKKWITPVGIGAGVLGLFYTGYRYVTGKKKEPPKKPALSGIPKSVKNKKGGNKPIVKSKKQEKQAVELL
jgi:hypothetical protein